MRKIYHLTHCGTCKRILGELPTGKSCEMQDIKLEKITEPQLDEMAKKAGSYEALFSRNALKYRSMGLKDKNLTEQDYKDLILQEYTFLKRPVIVLDNEIFVGNAPKVVEAAKRSMSKG